MRREYTQEDLLALSGIQHFHFCRRQWALIHIERQWQENGLTAEGRIMHQRADDPFLTEIRKGVVIARSMPVASYRLGLYGVCDVVEFCPSRGGQNGSSPPNDGEDPDSSALEGITLPGREGYFLPMPVEYKRGKEKEDPCDEVQLCAQALCLEEMIPVRIPKGALFYGQTRRRVAVEFTDALRALVERMAAEMHDYFSRGYTPRVKPTRACRACSLQDVCLPELQGKVIAASRYIRQHLDGE